MHSKPNRWQTGRTGAGRTRHSPDARSTTKRLGTGARIAHHGRASQTRCCNKRPDIREQSYLMPKNGMLANEGESIYGLWRTPGCGRELPFAIGNSRPLADLRSTRKQTFNAPVHRPVKPSGAPLFWLPCNWLLGVSMRSATCTQRGRNQTWRVFLTHCVYSLFSYAPSKWKSMLSPAVS